MKRGIILPVLLIILLLVMPLASASFFDSVGNLVTGKASEGTESASAVTEQVKCAFLGSDKEQKCYTSDGKFACSGAGSCSVDVSGETGTTLEWKSSCSGNPLYTVIDGNSEYIEFNCPVEPTTTITAPTPTCSKEQSWYCATETDCSSVAAYWCDGKCLDKPCPTCSNEQPWVCKTDAECKNAGGFWCQQQGAETTSNGWCQQTVCPTYTCNQKEPWNCKTDADCTGAGLKWCKNQWGEKCDFSCPEVIIKPVCPVLSYTTCKAGEESVPTFDSNGCPTGNYCKLTNKCTTEWKPVCGVNGITYSNECRANVAGMSIQYYGECGSKVVCNDNLVAEQIAKCQLDNGIPEKYIRSDGCTDVVCKRVTVTPTVAPQTPQPAGCIAETDPATGFVRYTCETKPISICPSLLEEERVRMKDSCYAQGGTPDYKKTAAGCDYLDCNFEKKEAVFTASEKCQTSEQIKDIENKCNSLGLKTVYEVVVFKENEVEKACKIAKCIEVPKSESCPAILRSEAKTACPEGAVEAVGIDERGCNVLKCVSKEENECPPIPPKEAFSKCEERGGKLIIKQDERGCMRFSECISKNEEEIYVEKVNTVPDTMELLQLALKLEEIRISLDAFSKKIDKIADYYNANNDVPEYEKFKRVKALLSTASDTLNKIKVDMRDKVDTLTTDDIEVFKYRIKEIKQILKKILFVMLGGEEAKEEITGIVDCGASSECMENAFKACKPAKIGQGGAVSMIVGLEGEKCVLKITMGNESMTCKIQNYALGTKNLGSLEQYCEGALVFRLAATPKIVRVEEMRAPNSVVNAIKLSADSSDTRYSFTVHDPDGIREFSVIKSNFGEVLVKAEPACTTDFTSELNFAPSDLPFRASVVDCGSPVMKDELNVDVGIPTVKEPIQVQQEQATTENKKG